MTVLAPLGWWKWNAEARRVAATILLVASALCVGASCKTQPNTQLVIRVDSDLTHVTEIECFGLHVERMGLKPGEKFIYDRSHCLGNGSVTLPTELGVLPHDPADDRRVRVVLTANPGTSDTFNQAAIVSFRPGHVVLLELFLFRDCQIASVSRACQEQGKTCSRGGKCIDIERPELPDLPEPWDAGIDATRTSDAPQADAPQADDAIALQDVSATNTAPPNQILNDSFEYTGAQWMNPWKFTQGLPAMATVHQDATTQADGMYSLRVDVTSTSSCTCGVQVSQPGLAIEAGKTYTLSFWMKSSRNRSVGLNITNTGSSYVGYNQWPLQLTPTWQPFTFTWTSSVSDRNASLLFKLAQDASSVWIDKVTMTP